MNEQNAAAPLPSTTTGTIGGIMQMAEEMQQAEMSARMERANDIRERILGNDLEDLPHYQPAETEPLDAPISEEVVIAEPIVLDNNRATADDLAQIPTSETREEILMAVKDSRAVAEELGTDLLPGNIVPVVTDEELVLFNDPKYKEPEPVDPTPRLKVLAEPAAPNTKKHYKLEFNGPAMKLLHLHTGDITGDSVAFSFVRTNPFIVRVPQDAEPQFSRLFHIKGGGSFADKLLNSQLRLIAQRDITAEISFVLEPQDIESKFPVVVRLREEAPVSV